MSWLERRELHRDAETWQSDAIDLLNEPGMMQRLGKLGGELLDVIDNAQIVAIDKKNRQPFNLPRLNGSMLIIPRRFDGLSTPLHIDQRSIHRVQMPIMTKMDLARCRMIKASDGNLGAAVNLPLKSKIVEPQDRGQLLLHESTHALQILGRAVGVEHGAGKAVKTAMESQAYGVEFDALDVISNGLMSRILEANYDHLLASSDSFIDLHDFEISAPGNDATEFINTGLSRDTVVEIALADKAYGFNPDEDVNPPDQLIDTYLDWGVIS